MQHGIIISTLQIVETGIGIVVIAAISDGVDLTDAAGACDLTPGVVGIAGDHTAGGIQDLYNVALQILDIVVLGSIVDERISRTVLVIQEVNVVTAPSLTNEQTVSVIIIVNRTADRFLRSQTICNASYRIFSGGKHRLKDDACLFVNSIYIF